MLSVPAPSGGFSADADSDLLLTDSPLEWRHSHRGRPKDGHLKQADWFEAYNNYTDEYMMNFNSATSEEDINNNAKEKDFSTLDREELQNLIMQQSKKLESQSKEIKKLIEKLSNLYVS